MTTFSINQAALADLSPSEEMVLAALCYGDIFDFALTVAEIATYAPFLHCQPEELATVADALVARGKIGKRNGYLFLSGRDALAEKRRKKVDLVAEKWTLIHHHLPPLVALSFVKGILLTGSLAAKNPTPKADADLLLILDHRRMWIGYLAIRLWLRRQKHIEFCPNYAISDRSLALVYPNLFTAIELSIAVPLKYGPAVEELESVNGWWRELIPNGPRLAEKRVDIPARSTLLTTAISLLVASPLGWLLDRLEYGRLRWRTRGHYLPNRSVYKPHPPTRQYRIFKAFQTRLDREGLAVPAIRAHLAKEFPILEQAMNAWGIDPANLPEQRQRGPRAVASAKDGVMAEQVS